MSSIWTVCYTRPSRYNWMLQYYLRAEGLVLSWVGTGRLIFSLNYSDADFAAVMDRFIAAAGTMDHDGWWWSGSATTNRSIGRQVLRASCWETIGLNLERVSPPSDVLAIPPVEFEMQCGEISLRLPASD